MLWKVMVDFVLNGKIILEDYNLNKFQEDFAQLLYKYQTVFKGEIRSYSFEECEIIEPEVSD